ncbi:scavenger receptor cysteine-rich type 1 protein M130-like [Esox lucius]|uniref:scavenger receptor cysteine-rich type 1 protein M130-like n=1 Tax=Esox lucius TaxID=8010 RepID=UPI001476B566|nr:scavenger receptor cysteine-rich type 1 protein M130-like [Esox lucius]
MSSLSYSTPDEDKVTWTEKEGLWLNIVVKEEDEEEDVFGAEEEITVILKEEKTGDLINTRSESSIRECNIKKSPYFCNKKYYTDVTCSESIQLVDGAGFCSGRLEVKSSQTWVSVCESDFDQQDAEVVCREIGCGAPVVLQGGLFVKGKGQTWDKEFQCKGNETRLLDCNTSDRKNNTCLPGHSVGITCSEPHNVRLVGEASRCAGRVELYYQEEWRIVGVERRYKYWEDAATVVCRQLGCGSSVSVIPGNTIRGTVLYCKGSEAGLRECATWMNAESYLITVICSDDSHQGNYRCVYNNYVFSHNFSSEGQLLFLTITASPHPAFIIRHVIVLLILLTVIITSCLNYKSTRGQKRVNRVTSMDLHVSTNVIEMVSLDSRTDAGPGEETAVQETE